jgi:hypothetical protein
MGLALKTPPAFPGGVRDSLSPRIESFGFVPHTLQKRCSWAGNCHNPTPDSICDWLILYRERL